MRICALFEKILSYGDKTWDYGRLGRINYPGHGIAIMYPQTAISTYWCCLPAGTYTVSAATAGNITCKVYTYDADREAAGMFPADDSEGVLPYTFTLTETREVGITFENAGWQGTEMSMSDVTGIRIHNNISARTGEVTETILLRPDEIAPDDTLAEAINSKKTIKFLIFPQFEAWGFCEQTITYVTVLDLDLAADRVIFRGRVSGVQSRMDSSGRYAQEITCGSAIDFLNDTVTVNLAGWHSDRSLTNWLTILLSDHMDGLAPTTDDHIRRGFILGSVGEGWIFGWTDEQYNYTALADTFTKGSQIQYRPDPVGRPSYFAFGCPMEFRERYYHGLNYLDVLKKIGAHKSEPIKLGENLKDIKIERGVTEGCYTKVFARSGVNSDGLRATYTAENHEMAAIYPPCVKMLTNDSIKCTAPRLNEYGYNTPEYQAMLDELEQYARAEAKKLSNAYVKITLSAVDLARIGMDGYDGFELGNYHPCVCPKLGLFGDEVRITAIRRNLADGKTAELTVEAGERLDGDKSSSTLSGQLSRISRIEQRLDSDSAAQTEITDGKITTALDGNRVRRMTKTEYDALTEYDSTVLYNVDNNGTNELYIGADHISSGGGGGGGSFDVGVPVYPTSDKRAWYVLAKGTQHHTRIYSSNNGITKSRINAEGVETLSFTVRHQNAIFIIENVLNNNKYDIRYSSPLIQPVTKTIESDTPIKMMLVTNQFTLRGTSPAYFDWLELYTALTQVVAVVNNTKVTLFSSDASGDDNLRGEVLGEVVLGEIE